MEYTNYLRALMKVFMQEVQIKERSPLNMEAINKLAQDETLQEALGVIMDQIKQNSKELLPPLKVQSRIPNAPAKEVFVGGIEIVNYDLGEGDELTIATVEGLEEIGGVAWNIESQTIEGAPQNSGDFTLTLRGVINYASGYAQEIESFLRWSIIPDPKSLWRDIEPDLNEPYPKANEDSHYIQTQNAKMLYVSKRGRSHAHVGSFRDDDGTLLYDEDSRWSVLAVADGAGSCKFSRQGSKIAVERSSELVMEALVAGSGAILEEAFLANKENPSSELSSIINEHIQKSIIHAVHTAVVDIHQEAKESGNTTKEYSTTLLLAAYKKTPKGHLVISFWVGDGVLAIYTKGKNVGLLGSPDGGEFAGQTQFLDASIFQDTAKLSRRIRMELVEELDALILATDGVSDPFFTSDSALEELASWDSFWENEIETKLNETELGATTSNLLAWLDFWSVGNHDDRSMALLLPIKSETIEEDVGSISSNEEVEKNS
jgi:serine/threonine protein phosphatase PrpC